MYNPNPDIENKVVAQVLNMPKKFSKYLITNKLVYKFIIKWLVISNMTISIVLAYEANTNLGEVLTENEIKKYAITIFPDGTNLPDGQGSVLQGKELYKAQCMMCHGEKGIEGPAARLVGEDGWYSLSDPLRITRIKKYPILLISVGGLWPYATTIFDYIRRAMPHFSPKSLNNNQVYALTAYILFLNDLFEKDGVLNKTTLLKITMPAKQRTVISVENKLSGLNSDD